VIIIGSVILINRARLVKVKTEPLQAVPDDGNQPPHFEKGSPSTGRR
jgi:hypothetical protein